jgi:hypothetical protein
MPPLHIFESANSGKSLQVESWPFAIGSDLEGKERGRLAVWPSSVSRLGLRFSGAEGGRKKFGDQGGSSNASKQEEASK